MLVKEIQIQRNHGISLIENLISMTIFLLIVLGVLEVYSLSRHHFKQIKGKQEADLAAGSALDKIKTDLRLCGLGFSELPEPIPVAPLLEENEGLVLRRVEQTIQLSIPLSINQSRISLTITENIKQGKELIISDEQKGEIHTISDVEAAAIILSSPLKNSYAAGTTALHLLHKVFFYYDQSKAVLRRKVNASPAQPLCEEVGSFDLAYSSLTNLVKISLSLLPYPENIYETTVFPKNTTLCAFR